MKSAMAPIRRAVFDTNILISAYLWPGTPRHALEIVRSGRCTLVSADAAIEEFVRVLGYRKFGLSPEEIAPLVHDLLSLSTLVSPKHDVRVITKAAYRSNGGGYPNPKVHSHIWTVAVPASLNGPADAPKPKQVTKGNWDEGNISWSPDGSRLYFVGRRVAEAPDKYIYLDQHRMLSV